MARGSALGRVSQCWDGPGPTLSWAPCRFVRLIWAEPEFQQVSASVGTWSWARLELGAGLPVEGWTLAYPVSGLLPRSAGADLDCT